MKENFMERTELEKRKPIFDNRAIFLLLWPVLIEQTLASTVGIADTIMVSSVGDAAVSAVGLIDTINNMFIQIFYRDRNRHDGRYRPAFGPARRRRHS